MAIPQSTIDDAQKALLERIVELAPEAQMGGILLLAEAFAWAVAPAQPHGGNPAQR